MSTETEHEWMEPQAKEASVGGVEKDLLSLRAFPGGQHATVPSASGMPEGKMSDVVSHLVHGTSLICDFLPQQSCVTHTRPGPWQSNINTTKK